MSFTGFDDRALTRKVKNIGNNTVRFTQKTDEAKYTLQTLKKPLLFETFLKPNESTILPHFVVVVETDDKKPAKLEMYFD